MSAGTAGRMLPVLLWALPLVSTFLATPTIVRGLGAEAYGAYAIVMATATFAVIPSPAVALARFSPPAAAGADLRRLVLRIASIAVAAAALNLFLITLPVLIITVPAAGSGPAERLGVLAVLFGFMAANALSQLALAWLQLRGAWTRGATIALLASVSSPLLAMTAVVGGAGWPAVLFAQALTIGAGLAGLVILCRAPAQSPAPSRPTPPNFGYIARFMARTALAGAAGSLLAISERWLLGVRFGPAVAGHFALAMSLALLIHAFVLALNVRLPVQFATARAAGTAALAVIYARASRMTALAAGLALTLALISSETFARLWLGDAIGTQLHPFLGGLMLSSFAMAMAVPMWMLAEATGHERINIALSLTILGGWGLALTATVPFLGPTAFVAARFIPLVAVPVAILFVERLALGGIRLEFWGRVVPRILLAMTLAFWASRPIADKGMTGFLLVTGIAALVYGAATWAIGLWRLKELRTGP